MLEFCEVTKTFGGTLALKGVSLTIEPSFHGIVGENGAGKSTLMKVLAGIYPASTFTGEVYLDGEILASKSVADANRRGVVFVPQELLVAGEMTVAENLFMGRWPTRRLLVSQGRLIERSQDLLDQYAPGLNASTRMSSLSPSQQRLAVIAGSFARDSTKVLILDEPTASLSDGEAELLARQLQLVKNSGITVIYISHRLDEIESQCDFVTVMRDGRVVRNWRRGEYAHRDILREILGHSAMPDRSVAPKQATAYGKTADIQVLKVEHLRITDPMVRGKIRVDDVSFEVRSGEIVGFFGLVGAGRTEMLRAIMGLWPGKVQGEIRLNGKPYRPRSADNAFARGLAILPESRKLSGIFEAQSVMVNQTAANYRGITKPRGLLSLALEEKRGTDAVRRFAIKTSSVKAPISSLSGGNQQKVLLARVMDYQPALLVLDEPTTGVDVGVREEIYAQVRDFSAAGGAVLLVSSDIQEALLLSTRIIVMRRGRIVPTSLADRTPERMLRLASAFTESTISEEG